MLGLNDKNTDGEWRYDGHEAAPVVYFNWKRNFPRKSSSRRARGRHCVQVNGAGYWVNRPCDTARAAFVCSKRRQNRRRWA